MSTVSKDFNVADTSDIGSDFDGGYLARDLQVVSNRLRTGASLGASEESYNGFTPGNDQFARLVVPTFTNTTVGDVSVMVRMADSPTRTYYQFSASKNGDGTGARIVSKRVAGTSTSLASDATVLTAGQTISVVVITEGATNKVLGLVGDTVVLSQTDSSIASGKLGLRVREDTTIANTEADDFSGGDLASATLRPSGDGTTTGWTRVAASGTWADKIDDDPDSNDGDTSYVLTPNVSDGSMWVELDDTPSDFNIGVEALIEIAAKKVNTAVMTVDLTHMYMQIERSDESTDMTAETAVSNVTVTASYTNFEHFVTATGSHTKTNWDAARLKLRYDHTTQSTIDTVAQIRVTAADVLVYYIPTLSTTYPFTIPASAVGVATLAKVPTFVKPLAATVPGVATLATVKTFIRTLPATVPGVATLATVKTIYLILAAIATGVATMTRKQFIALAATAIGVATLTDVLTAVVTLDAAAIGVATLTAVGVLLIALESTAIGVATLTKVVTFVRSLDATAVGVATLATIKTVYLTLAATATSVSTVVRKQYVLVESTATGVALLTRAATFVKTLAATAIGVGSIAEVFIPGGGAPTSIKSMILFVRKTVLKRSSS